MSTTGVLTEVLDRRLRAIEAEIRLAGQGACMCFTTLAVIAATSDADRRAVKKLLAVMGDYCLAMDSQENRHGETVRAPD